ncbi:hypothetical protein [Stutzerimonas nitrititolerans]|uniref:hypothetical protein n=1 Tax=Stutzerimonas nitrititolerans TaxID=2482751 RepID=UPI0028A89A26|nr:hypothetical protein [Stutzerimonas nitrititolerans]
MHADDADALLIESKLRKSPLLSGLFCVRLGKLGQVGVASCDTMVRMIEASKFYRAVREFAVTEPTWSTARLVIQTLPSERRDLTLVSQRVYGNRDEFLAVMAAAGLTRFDDILNEQQLVLPTRERLAQIKQQTGFKSGMQR